MGSAEENNLKIGIEAWNTKFMAVTLFLYKTETFEAKLVFVRRNAPYF
jgi:hypothetical protein